MEVADGSDSRTLYQQYVELVYDITELANAPKEAEEDTELVITGNNETDLIVEQPALEA